MFLDSMSTFRLDAAPSPHHVGEREFTCACAVCCWKLWLDFNPTGEVLHFGFGELKKLSCALCFELCSQSYSVSPPWMVKNCIKNLQQMQSNIFFFKKTCLNVKPREKKTPKNQQSAEPLKFNHSSPLWLFHTGTNTQIKIIINNWQLHHIFLRGRGTRKIKKQKKRWKCDFFSDEAAS